MLTREKLDEQEWEAANREPLTEADLNVDGDERYPDGCVNCAWGLTHQH